jgi:hypothetical protein
LLEPINNAINKFGEENILEYNALSLVKIIRKIIKIIAMTKVYNVTRYGITEQILSKLDKIKKDDEDIDIIDSIASDIISGLKKKKDFFTKRDIYICPAKDGSTVNLTMKDIIKISQIIDEKIFVLFPSLDTIYDNLYYSRRNFPSWWYIDSENLLLKEILDEPSSRLLNDNLKNLKLNKIRKRVQNWSVKTINEDEDEEFNYNLWPFNYDNSMNNKKILIIY